MVKEKRTNYNEELFSSLSSVRNDIAQEKDLARFIIFSDAVLKELAYFYPTNKEEFLLIKGIGENKFDSYADKFIPVIKNYIESKNILKDSLNKLKIELKETIKSDKPKINVKERTQMRKERVKELVLEKMPIEKIAKDLELTPNTIINYLARLLNDDASLDVEYIKKSIEGYNDIVKAFEKYGTEKIGPIYAEFSGDVEYANISLVKVLMLSK